MTAATTRPTSEPVPYPSLWDINIHYIGTFERCEWACGLIHESIGPLGMDTETTSLDPITGMLRLVQIAIKGQRFVFDVWKIPHVAQIFLRDILLSDRLKIFHRAKFDIKFLRTYFLLNDIPRVGCTMINSQLLACGNMTLRHNLKECLHRFLAVEISKDEQTSNWFNPILTENQVRYAATDTEYLVELYNTQMIQIRRLRMTTTHRIEEGAVVATAEKELNGVYLNFPKWMKRTERDAKRCQEVEWEIYPLLDEAEPQRNLFNEPAVFNINSDKELKKRLKLIGIRVPQVTDNRTGITRDTVDITKLAEIKGKHPVIPKLIEQATLNKAVSTYGANWKGFINPKSNRIHCNYNQIGTLTGRYTTSEGIGSEKNPMLLNIPADDDYRSCIEAGPGPNVLVWADYSQIELRILAELSQDEVMIQAFVEDRDLHTFTASLIFNVPLNQVSKIQRRRAKDLVFGIVFGIGPERFASKAGIPLNEAKRMMDDYYNVYRGLKIFLDTRASDAVKFKQSRTMSGRLVRYFFDPNNKGAVSLCRRNGKNTPIQGTSADMLKCALRLIYDRSRNTEVKLIHSQHDECLTECPDTHRQRLQATEIVESSMMDAGRIFLKTVPVKVDLQVGWYWHK